MGAGRRLREANPTIALISFQPDSPLHGLEGLKHMETAIVPGIYDASLADHDMGVSTEDAYTMVRRLAREEGLLVGISGGAAVAAALKVAKPLRNAVIVTIFPDSADKYMSERFWQLP
jgi:cysteine synthase B